MAETSRIFMQLTSPTSGMIKGESVVFERKDWIELDSWDWALNRSSKDDAVPEPSLLSLEKRMDRASTAMLQAMIKGEQLRAKIIIDDAAQNLMELSIMLEHVTIRDYKFSTEISEKGGSVEEDWTFDYRWITFEYQQNAKSGVKSVKLHRPNTADASKSGAGKEKELKKLVSELRAGGMSSTSLNKMWEDIVAAQEEERNRPDSKSPPHATKTPQKI